MQPTTRQKTFYDMINNVFDRNPDLKKVSESATDKKVNAVCKSPRHDVLSELEPEWSRGQ